MSAQNWDSLIDTMISVDRKGELPPLVSDRIALRALMERSHQDLLQTVAFLSEFGQLTQTMNKLKHLIQEAQAGRILLESIKSVQELAQLSGKELMAIYEVAYTLFSEKQFDKAAAVGALLGHLSPEVSSFWRFLGSCYWNMNNLQAALAPFLYAAMVDATCVDNHVAALECLIKLGLTQEALNYYRIAKEVLLSAEKDEEIRRLDPLIASLYRT